MARVPITDSDRGDLPVATRIRERLQEAGKRFHANDNIAAFVEPGELEAMQAEVAAS